MEPSAQPAQQPQRPQPQQRASEICRYSPEDLNQIKALFEASEGRGFDRGFESGYAARDKELSKPDPWLERYDRLGLIIRGAFKSWIIFVAALMAAIAGLIEVPEFRAQVTQLFSASGERILQAAMLVSAIVIAVRRVYTSKSLEEKGLESKLENK